jgi:uncharacterized membrane protein YhiD involved in acid resistance
MPASLWCAIGLAIAVTEGTALAATAEMSIALIAIPILRAVFDMAVSLSLLHVFSPPSAFVLFGSAAGST